MTRWIVGALLCVALIVGGWFMLDAATSSGGLIVQEAEGATATSPASAEPQQLEAGAQLSENQVVQVAPDGRVALSANKGTRLSLNGGTKLKVLEVGDDAVRVELDDGQMEAQVTAGSAVLGIVSGGREVVASDADIQVGVDNHGTLVVRPTRGVVNFREDGSVQAVEAGARLVSGDAGSVVVDDATVEMLLMVQWPTAAQTDDAASLAGTTSPYAEVRLRDSSGTVVTGRADAGGRFEIRAPLQEGANSLELSTVTALGETAVSVGDVERDTTPPSAERVDVDWGN